MTTGIILFIALVLVGGLIGGLLAYALLRLLDGHHIEISEDNGSDNNNEDRS